MAKSLLPLVKPNKNHANSMSQLTKRFMAAPPYSTLLISPPHLKLPTNTWKNDRATITKTGIMSFSSTSTSSIDQIRKDPTEPAFSSAGDPCLDLYTNNVCYSDCWQEMEQLLPVAWSHNPLTALKVICRMIVAKANNESCVDGETFRKLMFWLHQNHPNTLSCNVPYVSQFLVNPAQFFSLLTVLLCPGFKLLVPENYENELAFRVSLEFISDVFAECLKSDIRKLNKQSNSIDVVDNSDHDECIIASSAAMCYFQKEWAFINSPLVLESIARKVFPRESYLEYHGLEEADYTSRVKNRLYDDVLLPLRSSEACETRLDSRTFVVEKYLEDVKAGKSLIAANALLPYEIIKYVNHWSLDKVAELQWKAMVENILEFKNQGKKILNDCLVICSNCTVPEMVFDDPVYNCKIPKYGNLRDIDAAVALAVLLSELSEEPWRGKVIDSSRSPKVHLVRGDELRHKCDFVRRLDSEYEIDFVKVFDLILQEAVNANLKPEQMIKKVFVFTSTSDFGSISVEWNGNDYDYPRWSDDYYPLIWKHDYEAIRTKFVEKGYGNAVPEIVIWDMNKWEDQMIWVIPDTFSGVTILEYFSDNLIKLFLENGGEIRPDLVMEAVFSGEQYQKLVVVD